MDRYMPANDVEEDMRLYRSYSKFDPKSKNYDPQADNDSPEAMQLRDEIIARCGNTKEFKLWLEKMRKHTPGSDAKAPDWQASGRKFRAFKA